MFTKFAHTMNPKKRNTLVIIALVVLVGGLYITFDRSKKEMTPAEDNFVSSDTSTTTQVNLGDGVVATVPNDFVFEPVPLPSQPYAPSLNRAVIFAPSIEASVKQAVQTKVSEFQAELKKDSTKIEYWIDLGIYHKVAGDFSGAKIYWDYAGKISPTNFISFGNLGNMYAYQLKDMVQAEKYYNQAIKNGPTQIYLYIQLAEAFRDVSKDMTKARAVIDRGLLANPNNAELLVLKDSLK